MATGASTADLAIILIDARKGILPQTRPHSFIVSMIGVRDVALAINKMDLVGYSEARFNEIVAAYRAIGEELGFRSITPLPISALNGDNIATLSERTPWFQGEPLLPWLEHVDAAPASGRRAVPVSRAMGQPAQPGFSRFFGVGGERFDQAGGRRGRPAVGPDQQGGAHRHAGRRSRAAVAGQSVTLTLADEIDVSRGDVLAAVEGGRRWPRRQRRGCCGRRKPTCIRARPISSSSARARPMRRSRGCARSSTSTPSSRRRGNPWRSTNRGGALAFRPPNSVRPLP